MGTETSLRQNIADLLNNTLKFTDNNLPYAKDELSDTTLKNNSEYHFIVIGAGSAGATIAARLSEIKSVTVLLIEAGGKEYSIIDIPSLSITVASNKEIDWNYETERSNKYCLAENGTCSWPTGKLMGGSSSHNGMVATRGNRRDYDVWANETGDDSWSYQNMLKYFEKLENFKNKSSGPVPVTEVRNPVKIIKSLIEAAEETGLPEYKYDGPEQVGSTYVATTSFKGERWSANRAYLRPAKGRKNLIVTQHSLVHKILINKVTKRAYGVRYSKNGKIYEVKASKEIILSAGTINSAQILMLSGIGPEDHLCDLNIDVVKDAPVGENLIEHVSYARYLTFYVNDSSAVQPENVLDPKDNSISNYIRDRSGILSYGVSMGALGFFNADNLTSSETNLEMIYSAGGEVIFSASGSRQTIGMSPILVRPGSRGKILLRSDNPADKPKIYPNFFEDADDIRLLIKGIRMALRTGETEALKRHGSEFHEFSSVCDVHEKGSDEYWECELRENTGSEYHYVGTCRMGRENSSSAVLDSKLKVLGVQGLRVADASIMPNTVSAHTNIPVIAIAEKAADLIKMEYGLLRNLL